MVLTLILLGTHDFFAKALKDQYKVCMRIFYEGLQSSCFILNLSTTVTLLLSWAKKTGFSYVPLKVMEFSAPSARGRYIFYAR